MAVQLLSYGVLLQKVWTAIDRLFIKWKSDLSNKIKQGFLPGCSLVTTTLWMHHIDGNNTKSYQILIMKSFI